MQFEEKRIGDVVVLSPMGDLDVTNLATYEERLKSLVRQGVRALVWDLSAVSILPSTALGFLAANARQFAATGGRFSVVAPSRLVRSTLSTLGLEGVLRVRDTLSEALAVVKGL